MISHHAGAAEEVPRIPRPMRLLKVGMGLSFLVVAASMLNAAGQHQGGASIIWLSNGALIGVLLCAPRKQWPALLALGYAIDITLNLVQHNPPGLSAWLSVCNMVEVIVASALMFPAVARHPDLTEGRQFRSLLLYGVFLAPVAASFLASLHFWMFEHTPISQTLMDWLAADMLGIATATPLYLSFHHRRRFSARPLHEVMALFTLLIAASVAIFGAVTAPMLWVVLLILILLGIRLGFTGAALGVLVVTFIGGYLTAAGHGPISASVHLSMSMKILEFQFFIATSMLAIYATEVSRAAGFRMRRNLEASETRFRLLAEASRDVIVMADLEGMRQYVSPAVTELLGWSPEELIGNSYTQITHPDDIPTVRKLLTDCRAGDGHSPSQAFRCKKSDGTYLWLESNIRLVRDLQTGKPSGFVYVLRDISSRKAAEDQMQKAFLMVNRLAMVDGLTGVANRRLLDETLGIEWRKAVRDRTPLSLLLVDVDFFKSYNDIYGHLAGDACLRDIAKAIQAVLQRPADLLARYGGEEFVVVLPNTPGAGAAVISESVRKAVELCRTPHEGNPHSLVTVSVGCATAQPAPGSDPEQLLMQADAALYRAKSEGRNCIRTSGNELALK